MGNIWERYGKDMGNYIWNMGKIWEWLTKYGKWYGKYMGKIWERYGKLYWKYGKDMGRLTKDGKWYGKYMGYDTGWYNIFFSMGMIWDDDITKWEFKWEKWWLSYGLTHGNMEWYGMIWRFPKGVPPVLVHFIDGIFQYKPSILRYLPLMESPIWGKWWLNHGFRGFSP